MKPKEKKTEKRTKANDGCATTRKKFRVKSHPVGHFFRKTFLDGIFIGRITEIRVGAKGGRDRRCRYEDGDAEDLSVRELKEHERLNPGIITQKEITRFWKGADGGGIGSSDSSEDDIEEGKEEGGEELEDDDDDVDGDGEESDEEEEEGDSSEEEGKSSAASLSGTSDEDGKSVEDDDDTKRNNDKDPLASMMEQAKLEEERIREQLGGSSTTTSQSSPSSVSSSSSSVNSTIQMTPVRSSIHNIYSKLTGTKSTQKVPMTPSPSRSTRNSMPSPECSENSSRKRNLSTYPIGTRHGLRVIHVDDDPRKGGDVGEVLIEDRGGMVEVAFQSSVIVKDFAIKFRVVDKDDDLFLGDSREGPRRSANSSSAKGGIVRKRRTVAPVKFEPSFEPNDLTNAMWQKPPPIEFIASPNSKTLGKHSVDWYKCEDSDYPDDFLGTPEEVGGERGGSRQVALEKGFIANGWTAYFDRIQKMWVIWDPSGSRHDGLVPAVEKYNTYAKTFNSYFSQPSSAKGKKKSVVPSQPTTAKDKPTIAKDKPTTAKEKKSIQMGNQHVKAPAAATAATAAKIAATIASKKQQKSQPNNTTKSTSTTATTFQFPTKTNFHSPDDFYWKCRWCTFKNPYRRRKCEMCFSEKTGADEDSAPLTESLDIVAEISRRRPRNMAGEVVLPMGEGSKEGSIVRVVYSDYIQKLSKCGADGGDHPKAVPLKVLTDLFTCNYASSPCHYNCTSNSDYLYCRKHEPAELNTDRIYELFGDAGSAGQSSKKRPNRGRVWIPPTKVPIRSIDEFRSVNICGLGVKCIEDDILVEERLRDFLPLGLKVRKFFLGYGFFDANIIFMRRAVLPQKAEVEIVYRCKYEDGDQEDLTYAQILSLRQLYNNRFVREAEPQEKQIPVGNVVELTSGEVFVVTGHIESKHSLTVMWKGGGGVVGVDERLNNIIIGEAGSNGVVDILDVQLHVKRTEVIPSNNNESRGDGNGKGNNYKSVLGGPRRPLFEFPRQRLVYSREGNYGSTMGSYAKEADGLNLCSKVDELIEDRAVDPKTSHRPNAMVATNVYLRYRGESGASSESDGDDESDGDEESDGDDESDKKKSGDEKCDEEVMMNNDEMNSDDNSSADTSHAADASDATAGSEETKKKTMMKNEKDGSGCDSNFVRPTMEWDPGQIADHISYDCFGSLCCDICKYGGDDEHLILCDKCGKGYHMYCTRPILVNVPIGKWFCSNCEEAKPKGKSFEGEIVPEMIKDERQQVKIAQYLNLKFAKPIDFFDCSANAALIKHYEDRKNYLHKKNGYVHPKKTLHDTLVLDKIYQTDLWKAKKTIWLLPKPVLDPKEFQYNMTSWVAALKQMGNKTYSDDLIYTKGTPRILNDSKLDKIDDVSLMNIAIYREYKSNVANGVFPPLRVKNDDNVGFVVEACENIPPKTLLIEYAGVVKRISESGDTDSDSLMILLQTDDPETSLIIDPTKAGNIARFISGINNLSYESKKKVNVRTRRIVVDGEIHVILFSSRKIAKGEQLHYDYNAGLQTSRKGGEGAERGFYDTSHFT